MDTRLRRLEQEVLRAPGDREARLQLRVELCRLADFHDRLRWLRADPGAQDLVLHTVGLLLGPRYTQEETGVYAAGGEAHRIGAYRHGPSGVVLHLLPGGAFEMGTAPGPRLELEQPRRTVTVPPFLMGRFPILQEEWDRIGGDDERAWHGASLPIEGVSWQEVQSWLRVGGAGFRLPSEAEWEYACRAGTRSVFFWGDVMEEAYCWHGDPQTWRSHAPVKHLDRPNAFGLVDMAGNVAEWCEDTFVSGYHGAPSDGSPRRARWGGLRVVRGGDSFNTASHCRSAYRSMARTRDRGAGIGFRVAQDLPF